MGSGKFPNLAGTRVTVARSGWLWPEHRHLHARFKWFRIDLKGQAEAGIKCSEAAGLRWFV